jgi:hypothetical protein
MSDVVYSKRDMGAIQKRRVINYLYKGMREVLKRLFGYNKRQIKVIVTYPKITKEEELIEVANKISWAFPQKNNLEISILVDECLKSFDFSSVDVIPHQRSYLKKGHFKLVGEINHFDQVLLLKAKAIMKKPWWVYKSEVLDKWYYAVTESGLLQYGFSRTLSQKEVIDIEHMSQKNFQTMVNKNSHKKKAYCYVTGPSFDLYREFSFEVDSFKVICNSTVKNNDFLDYIGSPDLLVFADPVFHFSSCEYSAAFRDEVVKVYKKYKPFIAVPFNTVGLLLMHYPELKDRLIGIKGRNDAFHFPTGESLWIKNSQNILTLLMLPLASSIADEVGIIGADGRKVNETYFWQHSKSVQFDDLMNTAFETHPSFFRDRSYQDYYEEHCQFLENLILFGESQKKVYYSLTQSYIPALKKRCQND